ncbi:hypothetical protein [Actinomadura atramentaria]|uniref:hypothetical protein n=1 Tax=Actinomadura atramentaria TaxID=1990 RepID=UPI00035F8B00|nr:hypothetical protein [Actinomadura atramentaria]
MYFTFAYNDTLAGHELFAIPGLWNVTVDEEPRGLPLHLIAHDLNLPPVELADLESGYSPVLLVGVEPHGPVDEQYRCPAGWLVVRRMDCDRFLGPQHAQIRSAIRRTIHHDSDQDWPDAARTVPRTDTTEHADAARNALDALSGTRGAGQWWLDQPGLTGGHELIALAARDLIGTVPGWTRDAYRALTTPYRTAYGTWPHPHDTDHIIGT